MKVSRKHSYYKLQRSHGWTLSEMMVAVAILSLVLAGAVPTFIMCIRTWAQGSVDIQAAQEASFAIQRIMSGVGAEYGLRSANSSTVTGVPATSQAWRVYYEDIGSSPHAISYDGISDYLTYSNADFPKGVNIGKGIIAATVTNMASSQGITISITCLATDGRFSSTNTMTTSVRWRNPM